MRKQPTESDQKQNVDENISPIYQALKPEWNDTETLHRPLMARGDFSNAWVVYDKDEAPPHVDRPDTLTEASTSAHEKRSQKHRHQKE